MKTKDSAFIRFLELLLVAIIAFGLLLAGSIPEFFTKENDTSFWGFSFAYLSFIGIWAAFVIYMLIRKTDRPILKTISHRMPGNNIRRFLIGLLVYGFGFNGLSILLAWLHGDVKLTYSGFEFLPFIYLLICVFVQSSAEELVCRVFIYQKARRLFPNNAWVAIIFNALFFAALHLMNDGVTVLAIVNISAVGILYSVIVHYTNSVWCTMAAHAGWNFTQNIIFGLPNSGTISKYSVFTLDAGSAKDSIFYNVGFGVEGTVFVCALLFAAALAIVIFYQKKGYKEENIWENK